MWGNTDGKMRFLTGTWETQALVLILLLIWWVAFYKLQTLILQVQPCPGVPDPAVHPQAEVPSGTAGACPGTRCCLWGLGDGDNSTDCLGMLSCLIQSCFWGAQTPRDMVRGGEQRPSCLKIGNNDRSWPVRGEASHCSKLILGALCADFFSHRI